MLSRSDFETAVRFYMREMGDVCLLETPEGLRHLLGFSGRVEEFRSTIAGPYSTDVTVLSGAFGLVDEFVEHKWSEVIGRIYDTYTAEESAKQQTRGG